MTHAHVALAGAFRRCCRSTGRFDGAQAAYYIRDREW